MSMTCPPHANRRVLSQRQGFTAFDKHFHENTGFIRPVRKGQCRPACPLEMPDGTSYLVQDLDGNWLALISNATADAAFAEVRENKGVPVWTH
jgi:hypothetical protein